MSKFINSLIDLLVGYPTEEKGQLGTRIVELIGGDATKNVTNLPLRRGPSDGGMDGRIRVIATKINKRITEEGVYFQRQGEEEQDAGISVKIQADKFSRVQLGGFKLDLERENIYLGLIITAKGLSPDAEVEIKRLNKETIYRFYHIPIQNILSGKVEAIDGLKFIEGDISQKLREGIAKWLSQPIEIEEE